MVKMNHDDEEAQVTKASGHAASEVHDDDDSDGSFDGMEVEDWLIKQQAKTQGSSHQETLKGPNADVSEGCLGDSSVSVNRKHSKEISRQGPTMSSTVEGEGTFADLPTTETTMDPAVILDAEAKTLESYQNFVVAEVSLHNDQVLVIEGVKTMDPRRKRIFMFLGVLFVGSVIAIAAGTITNVFTSSSSSALAGGGGGETLAPSTTTIAPVTTITSRGGNLSVTIGDAWTSFSPGGIENFAVVNGALDVFQKLVTQTDKNFTFFSASKQADVMGGVGMVLIGKALSPMYNGHVLSGMESLLVQGTVFFEDMYDGMVLQSVAGYPLLIQLNPLRVNNNTVIPTEVNLFYKNGVVHTTYEFPRPLVSWLTKTVYDVLLETNQARNDDLSTFIALIDSSPDLKGQLQQERGLVGLTIFVPTNDGMATVDPNVMADPTLLQNFLLNHFAAGNFVRRCWWTMPTGTRVGDTELTLETQAEQILSLEINDVVVINGNVTIIQEDVLSIEGVIQVINKPLLP